MELTEKQTALFSWWRTRAIMIMLLVVLTFLRYFGLLGTHRIEFWQIPFSICWAVSCWPQVLDKTFGIYCTLSRAERKRLPKSRSYWIANLFATVAISLPLVLLLESLWGHSR